MAEIMAVLDSCGLVSREGGRKLLAVGNAVTRGHLGGFPAADVHDGGFGHARLAQFSRSERLKSWTMRPTYLSFFPLHFAHSVPLTVSLQAAQSLVRIT